MPPDDIEAFGLTLAPLIDRAEPARSLLINKPTNRERHTGGVRIQPGSYEEQALTDWIFEVLQPSLIDVLSGLKYSPTRLSFISLPRSR